MKRGVLLIAALLAGCTVGPNYRRPDIQVPPDFRGRAVDAPVSAGSLGDLAWWEIFQDETLQALLRTALEENYDVRIAAARILDARTQITIARSFQLPTVGATATAPYVRTTGDRAPLQERESFSPLGTLDLFWEIDLWGRLRRATEAARADLLASEDVQRFVITSLVSDVATAYFELRELDLELEIATRTLASRQDALRLVTLRQEGGVAALIDVRQAEVLLYTAAETIPDVQRRIEQAENFISLLLGRSPDAVPRGRPLLTQVASRACRRGSRPRCSSAGPTSGRRRVNSRRRRRGSVWPRPTTFRGCYSPARAALGGWRSTGAGSARPGCLRSAPRSPCRSSTGVASKPA